MRLDAHHHLWKLANPFTVWPTPDLVAIHRDFEPADLRPHLDACRIDATIVVQAAPSLAETKYLLGIARDCPFVEGVVGWIDFQAPDALGQLAELAANPLLKGLRPMLQDISERRWILRPEFSPIFGAMLVHGLCLDALVRPSQIEDIAALASRHVDLPIILDHGGKPPIGDGEFASWAGQVGHLAGHPNVHCKLSGLWTEANGDCSIERIAPYARYLLDVFGPARLIWGSDWPVLGLSGRYEDWLEQCEALFAHLSEAERMGVFGLNGRRFYGIV